MEIRTENLTILFVDIAGFTATTSRQSRVQNAKLLETFDKTLLPLIKRFKGTVVKSIGDALLITFRSPTDAMLCSMALQDAMHEHNLRVTEDEKIHIRVAANLGEVRVTKRDIFGEPVNVASRIEGITPADEIYFSEAVYMAMNKAEVPSQEIGFKELSGIAGTSRIYGIPRFATHRLVPQGAVPAEEGSEILYPYGGMHHRGPQPKKSFTGGLASVGEGALENKNKIFVGAAGLLLVALLYVGLSSLSSREGTQLAVSTLPAGTPTPLQNVQMANNLAPAAQPQGNAVAGGAPVIDAGTTPVSQPPASTGAPLAGSASPAASSDIAPVLPTQTGPTAVPGATAPQADAASTSSVAAAKPPASKPKPAATKKPAVSWSVASAKQAYREGRLSKPSYKQIVEKLEVTYENRIRELKLAYRGGKISESTYEARVRQAKIAYRGY